MKKDYSKLSPKDRAREEFADQLVTGMVTGLNKKVTSEKTT